MNHPKEYHQKKYMRAYLFVILSAFILVTAFTLSQVEASVPLSSVTPFSSEEGRFTMEAPGEPQRTHMAHSSFIGTIHVYTYKVRTTEANYTMAYSDVPKIGIFFAGPKNVLKRAKKGFLKNAKGEELDYYPTDHEGTPGMELKFKLFGEKPGDKNQGIARFFLVKNRVYVLVVTYMDSSQDEANEKFLDSFHLVDQKKSPLLGSKGLK